MSEQTVCPWAASGIFTDSIGCLGLGLVFGEYTCTHCTCRDLVSWACPCSTVSVAAGWGPRKPTEESVAAVQQGIGLLYPCDCVCRSVCPVLFAMFQGYVSKIKVVEATFGTTLVVVVRLDGRYSSCILASRSIGKTRGELFCTYVSWCVGLAICAMQVKGAMQYRQPQGQ